MWKGSKLTSKVQRLKVNVKRLKVNVQRFKVTHAVWGQNLSTSVHFHHVVGISINYRRGENSMNVEILNRNNSMISTNLSSSCFNSNSSALMPVRMLMASACDPVGGRLAMIEKWKRGSACNMCQPAESTMKYESAKSIHMILLLVRADVVEIHPPNHTSNKREGDNLDIWDIISLVLHRVILT